MDVSWTDASGGGRMHAPTPLRSFDDDEHSLHLPRQDLPGMMKSLKSSYKSRK